MSRFLYKLKWITIFGCLILLDPIASEETKRKCGVPTHDKNRVEKDKYISTLGEFPWTIDITDNSTEIYLCAGSLIHPKVVLTSAACLVRRSLNDLIIRAGLWDRESGHESHQRMSAIDIIIHPKRNRHSNDVGLIILNETVTLDGNVNTICLPPSDHVTVNGTNCLASGWGFFDDSDEYSKKMKRIHLTTTTLEECEEAFRRPNLDISIMCAIGKESTDSNIGDSGGPMVCLASADDVEQYHQVGIVSFGALSQLQLPGGYANVSNARSWIDVVMKEHGFDTSYYTA